MSVIWVIESPRANDWQIAPALLGDYAVRVVASCASFANLAMLAKANPPHLIIAKQNLADFDRSLVLAATNKYLGGTRLLLVNADDQDDALGIKLLSASGQHAEVSVNIDFDGFAFSRFIRGFLNGESSTAHTKNVITYKDIAFDTTRFICNFITTGESDVLPLKEARILTALLAKPGACVSRHEIQSLAWPGVRVGARTIDSHVSRLRRRLVDSEVAIESRYGSGYVLK